jgi:ankyrin repeat protein
LTGLVSSLSGNINTNIDTHFFNLAVENILNHSPNDKIQIKNKDGDSAIILAGKGDSKYNRIIIELINNLIKKDANLDDINNDNKTAYDYAKAKNNNELARYILRKKAIILARNTNIRYKYNGDKLMAILKELPKEYWFHTDNGYTILMHLANKGNYELVKYILDETSKPENENTNEEYVDISAKVQIDDLGYSALSLAGKSPTEYNDQTKLIIDALIEKGKYDLNPEYSKYKKRKNQLSKQDDPQHNTKYTKYRDINDLLEFATENKNTDLVYYIQQKIDKNKVVPKKFWERQKDRFSGLFTNNPNKPKAGKRTAKKSRKMRKRKARKTRRVR